MRGRRLELLHLGLVGRLAESLCDEVRAFLVANADKLTRLEGAAGRWIGETNEHDTSMVGMKAEAVKPPPIII